MHRQNSSMLNIKLIIIWEFWSEYQQPTEPGIESENAFCKQTDANQPLQLSQLKVEMLPYHTTEAITV